MTRTITSAANTAAKGALVRPVLFVKLEYDSGDSLINSSNRTITFDGDDYIGVGDLGKITSIAEDSELQAQGVSMELSGVDTANIAIAFNQQYQGRPATVWLGFLDSSYSLIADPVLAFKGLMDNQIIKLGQEGVIKLNVEDFRANWDRPRERRYNNEDQQDRFPGDKGLEFVEQAKEKRIVWGKS